MEEERNRSEQFLNLTADIVAAHVANNTVAVTDLPGLIGSVFSALSGLTTEAKPEEVKPEPAVSIRASVKPDYIVCLEDGKKLKMLKRHLMTRYSMSPADYRAKWGLPADYPMVAPNYAEARRSLAKSIGLGRKPGTVVKASKAAAQQAAPAKSPAAPAKTPAAPAKAGETKAPAKAKAAAKPAKAAAPAKRAPKAAAAPGDQKKPAARGRRKAAAAAPK